MGDFVTIKVTGYAFMETSEGLRVSYTYSKIDDNGNVLSSNVRGSYIDFSDNTKNFLKKMDEAILNHIK